MDKVLLEFIEWGKDHWWFFGWTVFWCLLILASGIAGFTGGVIKLFTHLPVQLAKQRNISKYGWPPKDESLKLKDNERIHIRRFVGVDRDNFVRYGNGLSGDEIVVHQIDTGTALALFYKERNE